MAFTISNPAAGYMQIANIDSGVTQPNASSASPTPPMKAGMIVEANDPTYGDGEFILLLGVANTVVGSPVTYNATTFQTALAPVGANKPQPIAIAMSANGAGTWGWYQISGIARAKKTSGLALAANAAVGILTAGLVAATGTGKEIQGAFTAAVSTTSTLVSLVINRPHMQGRTT